MSRPKSVYRGKRRHRWVISLVLIVLLLLLTSCVWLYFHMQQYIVYDGDELRLVPPFLAEERGVSVTAAPQEAEETPFEPLPGVEIVVAEPDFSDVDLVDEESVDTLRARYIPAASVTAENLGYYAFSLADRDESALVVQLKTTDGYLHYQSALPLAAAYGINGSSDIREAVASLKERGIYLVAEISTILDEAMATRNTPLALKSGSGQVFSDSSGSYLDPYNKDARAYIVSLMEELAAMGFDEVLLTGLAHPRSEDILFSQDMTVTPSVGSSVSTFAVRMSEEARALGLACSALCDTQRLRAGSSGEIGQDLELFFRVFDRVYVRTESYLAKGDAETLEGILGHSAAGRIVPVVTGEAPETDSWAVE